MTVKGSACPDYRQRTSDLPLSVPPIVLASRRPQQNPAVDRRSSSAGGFWHARGEDSPHSGHADRKRRPDLTPTPAGRAQLDNASAAMMTTENEACYRFSSTGA